ncbi:MAG TPA: O-antigen ligase family protein [Blastocatellia bacterium]|nr:O-antigen ligase family protein [Blastocatellia bacterium]
MNNSIKIDKATARGSHGLAFAGLFLFTLLLYARPNEAFPDVFGTFPIVKIVAILTLAYYCLSKLVKGEPLTAWPLELKMLMVIVLLAFAFIPIAEAPQDSYDVLFDVFLKVVAIFILMVNLLDTRERLVLLLKVVVIIGAVIAIFAIRSYALGQIELDETKKFRIMGVIGGMFGNPNDMATSFDLMLPLGVALALMHKGLQRAFYFACAGLIGAGVVASFSRAGFLGLLGMSAVLLWKVGRRNRALTALAFVIALGVFLTTMPGGYGDRIVSIFDPGKDATGSRQARRDLLERAVKVAAAHPFIGVGIGNYHIYSHKELRAHNSYLEISAELGVAGLIAYLILLFAPFRSLRRIERDVNGETASSAPAAFARGAPPPLRFNSERDREIYYLSVALQAAFVAYFICSSFASIQYFWYIYYIIGFAVGLRVIHGARASVPDGETAAASLAGGTLWKAPRRPVYADHRLDAASRQITGPVH